MAKPTRTRSSSPPKRKPTSEAPAPRMPASEPAASATSSVKEVSPASVAPSPPSHAQIAARAFELYLTRGGAEGHAMSDWLRAEGELRA